MEYASRVLFATRPGKQLFVLIERLFYAVVRVLVHCLWWDWFVVLASTRMVLGTGLRRSTRLHRAHCPSASLLDRALKRVRLFSSAYPFCEYKINWWSFVYNLRANKCRGNDPCIWLGWRPEVRLVGPNRATAAWWVCKLHCHSYVLEWAVGGGRPHSIVNTGFCWFMMEGGRLGLAHTISGTTAFEFLFVFAEGLQMCDWSFLSIKFAEIFFTNPSEQPIGLSVVSH